jgi:two-component system nitrogen regulation response regulator GlnG
MKRVLVVDESQAVRETLALILGRDFAVLQRPLPVKDVFSYSAEKVDLLILGISSSLGMEISNLSEIASQVPFPVLFLVDSKYTVDVTEERRGIEYLAKPFNPYELKEKVGRLLTRPPTRGEPTAPPLLPKERITRYLEFPYLSPPTSILAKRFALTRLPILILGEVGCGQQRVARAMYSLNDAAGAWISASPPRISREVLLEQMGQVSRREGGYLQQCTLFLHGLDALGPSGQSSLLSFLQEEEERGRGLWILSSSRVDLLERVYRGEFLDALYYRLATLTLRLTPLRERLRDLPDLVTDIAQECARGLGLGKVTFTDDALERMRNYLWFGNLGEMESVLSRTLAVRRKESIGAGDLLFGIGDEEQLLSGELSELRSLSVESRPEIRAEEATAADSGIAPPKAVEEEIVENEKRKRHRGWVNGDYPDLKILINELAHELKNPMVTIKTFAQLLSERFDDATFRIRFQETVGSDIERMDDLLESLLDFSRFAHPMMERIFLYEQMRQILEEIAPECIRREATIRWGRKAEDGEVFADEIQFRYALKNVFRTVLAQVKPKGEIQIDVEEKGKVSLSYAREGARMSSFTQYLGLSSPGAEQESLPLRILLAKIVLKRIGGEIEVDHPGGEKVLIRIALPAA